MTVWALCHLKEFYQNPEEDGRLNLSIEKVASRAVEGLCVYKSASWTEHPSLPPPSTPLPTAPAPPLHPPPPSPQAPLFLGNEQQMSVAHAHRALGNNLCCWRMQRLTKIVISGNSSFKAKLKAFLLSQYFDTN